MAATQVRLLTYSASDKILLASGWVIFAALFMVSAQYPFFWDNILNARIATHYWEQGFASLVPPTELDAGHPPGFNLYLAGAFSFYGRHLVVAHIAMLPFLAGIVFHFWRLVVRYVPEHARWVAMALFLLDPTVLAQATQVSPDIAMLCFILAALDALASRRRTLLMLSLIGMSMMSFRGVLLLPGILLLDVLLERRPLLSVRRLWPYVPAALLLLGWWWVHYRATGWAVSPPDETYGTHREAVGLMGMARNMAILLWRILDQGRVLVLLVLGALLLLRVHRKASSEYPMRPLVFMLLVPTVLWALFFVPLSNPIGHRYWMVTFAGMALMAAWLLSAVRRPWVRSVVTVVMLLGLFSGHWWLYPEPIAKGWDSTLAHHSWFVVQRQMDAHLRQADITENICTDFPNLVNHGHSQLLPESRFPQHYLSYAEHKGDSCSYVVYGNVMNGFEQEDLNSLARDYVLDKEFRSGPVFLRLYLRKP